VSKQRLRFRMNFVVIALAVAVPVALAPAEARPSECAALEIAELPFRACIDPAAPGGGFSFHGPGQSSALGGLLFDEGEEPFFLMSTDFEAGASIGGHAPPPSYFRLTLRWDSSGPRRDTLTVEVCGPQLVPVRVGAAPSQELRGCGQWITLIDGLLFPDHTRLEPPSAAWRR
jgi:hypothetical protein